MAALLLSTGIMIAPPVARAQFPVVTTATSSRASNAVDDSCTLPASIAAGDLMFCIHGSDGSVTRTFPSPWVEIKDALCSGSACNIGVAYLIASGGETSVTVTKSVTERFSAIAIRITAASWHGTTPPEISTGAIGNSASPDPDSITASWGSANNLFVATIAFNNGLAGNTVTAWPTNYTANQTQSPDISSAARVAIATRDLAAANDDPGTFTITSDQWWAGTIVVRPAAGGAAPKPVRPPIVLGARVGGVDARENVRLWPAVMRWRGSQIRYDERVWTYARPACLEEGFCIPN